MLRRLLSAIGRAARVLGLTLGSYTMRAILLIALLSLVACGSEAVTDSRQFLQWNDRIYEAKRFQPVSNPTDPKPEVLPEPEPPQPMPQPQPMPAPAPAPVDMSVELPNPRLSGYLIQTTPDSYAARVSVDAANAAVAARFEWPIQLPSSYKTASLRTVSLAAVAAWLPASSLCASMGKPGAALIEKPGNVKICITQRWVVSVVVDGAETVIGQDKMTTQIADSLQAGTSIGVLPGQRVSLRLDIYGSADISKLDADVIARIQQ